ncbi:hypothetical protein IPZ61_33280 [Streptomyces sioyaensis]|uniref:hypothetical protein n=1 Tax=Streptomyces sioyaensis TaxID=67364 RepID=UPI001F1CCC09|nr:hypothetical protein [Streptomyces sioyaensis]MCF3178165.1 hypothetical protein [Streptomyces sioyaensis]
MSQSLADYDLAMPSDNRSLQSHGLSSRVYVPILVNIFNAKYAKGDEVVEFTLDDIRAAAQELGISVRNPADLAYRMRSRTVLPELIRNEGFFILSAVGRGKYRLGKADSAIIDTPENEPLGTLDLTPFPVRRLLPENLADFDEQALLTVVGYCKILDHFTGLTNFRLRSHVRKSVPRIGQAELDEVSVAIAHREDEQPVIVPVEAKAVADAINRVQISAMVSFCETYFPGHEVRPLAIKVDYESTVHVLEFNPTEEAADLTILRSAAYDIRLSEAQIELIRQTDQRLL